MRDTSIEAKIDHLEAASLAEVKLEWQKALGTEPPKGLSRKLMSRAIAHEWQIKAHGRLKAKSRNDLSRALEVSGSGILKNDNPKVLGAGARLMRDWHGVTHHVEVTEEGFRWNNEVYGSLSAIARQITGARWNGPRFFGLRRKARGVAS